MADSFTRRKVLPMLAAGAVSGSSVLQAGKTQALRCWFVDSLDKIFADDSPGTKQLGRAEFHAARRSHVSIQVALRAEENQLEVEVDAKPLRGPGRPIGSIAARWVEYVGVKANTPGTPDEELIRKAPGRFPDALLDEFPAPVGRGETRSVWLTVAVPADQQPGVYQGELLVRQSRRVLARLPYTVTVRRALVPHPIPLAINQYFNLSEGHIQRFYGCKRFSPEWWELIANIARFLAGYHHSAMMAGAVGLSAAEPEGEGLRFDFSNFERFFEIFLTAGVDRYIDGGNLIRRERRRDAPVMMGAWVRDGDRAVLKSLPYADPQAQAFLDAFLPALHRRLEQRAWTSKYLQGVLDEPNEWERKPFVEVAAAVRRLMPGVKMIEPVGLRQDVEFMKDIDIWVAHMGTMGEKLDVLARHKQAGGAVWHYTALSPRGRYANRFIDYSLLKVRLLHWMNFKHGASGFLHWGGNYWGPEPFADTQPIINEGRTLLPPGDAYITYPNRARRTLYSSIRLEQMREGIEDFGLLAELARTGPARAESIAADAVQSLTDFVREPARFRRIHRALLEASAA